MPFPTHGLFNKDATVLEVAPDHPEAGCDHCKASLLLLTHFLQHMGLFGSKLMHLELRGTDHLDSRSKPEAIPRPGVRMFVFNPIWLWVNVM